MIAIAVAKLRCVALFQRSLFVLTHFFLALPDLSLSSRRRAQLSQFQHFVHADSRGVVTSVASERWSASTARPEMKSKRKETDRRECTSVLLGRCI